MIPVTFTTKPDIFRFSSLDKKPLPYIRILGAITETEHIVVREEMPKDEWFFELPYDFTKRLLSAMKYIKSGEPMNCHRFSRIMTGTQKPRFASDDESYALSEIYEKNKATTLGLGQIGLIGSAAEINSARHSLIGLGEENDYSIQVMSAQSDIGIARYDDVLNFYRGSWPNEKIINLFRAEL